MKKVEIEDVGTFSIPDPVWKLLRDITTECDAARAEAADCRAIVASMQPRIDIVVAERDAARAEVETLDAELVAYHQEITRLHKLVHGG